MPARVAYEFLDYRFEPFNARLIRGDRIVPLTAKAADTLLLLVQRPDVLVTKEELLATVWLDAVVEENNLTQQISALRKALGHDHDQELIQTVPRRGYRFAVRVRAVPVAVTDAAAPIPASVSTPPPAVVEAAVLHPTPSRPRSRVAWALCAALVVLVGGGAVAWSWQVRQRTPSDAQAAFERGTELYRRGDARAAVVELQRAIALDPNHARAHGTLAHALNKLSTQGSVRRVAGQSPSVEAAARAVAIDPSCAECQGTLGLFLAYHDWEWQRAEAHLREAIRLDPGRASIRPSLAQVLLATGRTRQALEEIDFALGKSPYQVGWHVIRASILYADRRYPDAIAAADRALSIDDTTRGGWEWRSKALFQLGRGEEAINALSQVAFAAYRPALEDAVRTGGVKGGLRKLLEVTGDWHQRVEQTWRRGPWHVLLGDTDGALHELETALEMRNVNLMYAGVDPVYDGIRHHPRFQKLLAGIGLSADENGGSR